MSDPDFGEKQYTGVGFPTPFSIPDDTICRTLKIPADVSWEMVVMGCLMLLTEEFRWQQYEGAITKQEAAARMQEMFDAAYTDSNLGCPADGVDTPYWDEDSEVDDEAPFDMQTWYGEVDDPTVAPTELTFRENAEIWTFAGLLALAGAPGAALSFLTIAPKFVLAFKQHDIGKIIRVFIDADKAAQFTDDGSDTVKEIKISADPSMDSHQIYITVGDE